MTTADPSLSTLLSATVPRAALLEKLRLYSLIEPKHSGTLISARRNCLHLITDNLAIRCRVEVPAIVEAKGLSTCQLEDLARDAANSKSLSDAERSALLRGIRAEISARDADAMRFVLVDGPDQFGNAGQIAPPSLEKLL
jgi:hypothetical protein